MKNTKHSKKSREKSCKISREELLLRNLTKKLRNRLFQSASNLLKKHVFDAFLKYLVLSRIAAIDDYRQLVNSSSIECITYCTCDFN